MKKVWPMGGSFWAAAELTAVTLVGLAALAEVAKVVYATPAGRYPAKLIAVMRNRELVKVGGLKGYYEALNGDEKTKLGDVWPDDQKLIFDRSFRIFRFKPNLTWERDRMTTNSFGIVGRERALVKPPNTRRVALLGSSLTSGHMLVKANETFGALLEDRLNLGRQNAESQRFEVLNFACIGYTLPQIVDTAEEEPPRFGSDVYVLALDELAVSSAWAGHLVRITRLGIDPKYDFLRAPLRQAGVSRTDDPDTIYDRLAPFRVTILRDFLLELKATAQRHHASLIVLLLPAVEVADLSRRRMDTLRKVLDSLDVPIVDLLDSFDGFLYKQQFAIWYGDPHYNVQGHAIIFENLYKKLRAQPAAWAALAGNGPESRQDFP
jgi:hypothetical protein